MINGKKVHDNDSFYVTALVWPRLASLWFLRACGFLPFYSQFTCTRLPGGSGLRAPPANLRTVARCEQRWPGDGPHHLHRLLFPVLLKTQAVMKAVRKCAPVPIILLFINILFIRNYSEKETGDEKQKLRITYLWLILYLCQFLVINGRQYKTLRWLISTQENAK